MSRMNLQARCAGKFLVGLLSASFLIAPVKSDGAELKEETLNAWSAYIQHANSSKMDAVSTVHSSGSTKNRTDSNRFVTSRRKAIRAPFIPSWAFSRR